MFRIIEKLDGRFYLQTKDSDEWVYLKKRANDGFLYNLVFDNLDDAERSLKQYRFKEHPDEIVNQWVFD